MRSRCRCFPPPWSLRSRACERAATAETATTPGPHVESDADAALEALAYDPQTAGGLLISLPADRGAVLEATFASRGLIAARIGAVEAGAGVVLG